MSLKARIDKMESRIGRKRVPSNSEFRDAMVLLDRHFMALEWPRNPLYDEPADPEEVALMRLAEETAKSPQPAMSAPAVAGHEG